MRNLTNKLKEFSIRFFGNKVNLAGITLISTGIYAMFSSEEIENVPFLMGFLSEYVGISLMMGTFFGKDTYDKYKDAKQHIAKNKKFDERYLKNALGGKAKFFGYCPAQGIYLASKETGHLDEFKKAKKKYSKNIIPHF